MDCAIDYAIDYAIDCCKALDSVFDCCEKNAIDYALDSQNVISLAAFCIKIFILCISKCRQNGKVVNSLVHGLVHGPLYGPPYGPLLCLVRDRDRDLGAELAPCIFVKCLNILRNRVQISSPIDARDKALFSTRPRV